MKSILFVLGLSVIASTSIAQHFSAGVRTGASYWPAITQNIEMVEGNSGFSWEKSVYGRYESKGRFAIEANMAHSGFNFRYTQPNWDYFEGPPYEFLAHRGTVHVVSGNVLAQFRVTNSKSKVTSYFGAGVSYGKQIEHHTFTVRYYSTKEVAELKNTYEYGLAFCDLNNYTSYAINNHLNVHSVVSFDVDPFDALSSFRPANQFPESRLSLTIGCGYTF